MFKNKIWLFIILFVVPVSFMYLLAKGKTNTNYLQYYGKTEALAKVTPIKDFEFMTLDSTLFTKENVKGKTLVVSTLIPSCPTVCPVLFKQIKFLVYDKIANKKDLKDVVFISHLLDTTGIIPDLKSFVSEQDLDPEKWVFVTGKENPIYDIDLPFDTITGKSDNLLHSEVPGDVTIGGKTYYKFILLIDKYQKVRGMYLGDKTNQIERIRTDINALFIEYKDAERAKLEAK